MGGGGGGGGGGGQVRVCVCEGARSCSGCEISPYISLYLASLLEVRPLRPHPRHVRRGQLLQRRAWGGCGGGGGVSVCVCVGGWVGGWGGGSGCGVARRSCLATVALCPSTSASTAASSACLLSRSASSAYSQTAPHLPPPSPSPLPPRPPSRLQLVGQLVAMLLQAEEGGRAPRGRGRAESARTPRSLLQLADVRLELCGVGAQVAVGRLGPLQRRLAREELELLLDVAVRGAQLLRLFPCSRGMRLHEEGGGGVRG